MTTLLTYYTESFKSLADLTVPRMRQYAEHWHLDFLAVCRDNSCGIWHKLDTILNVVKLSPHPVIWLDVDCLVLDEYYDLTAHPDVPLTTGLDADGLCAGVLSVGNQQGIKLLETVKFLGDLNGGHKQDQSALRHLIANFKRVEGMVKSNIILADPANPCKSAPIYHAWASARGYDQAVQRTKEIIERGYRL